MSFLMIVLSMEKSHSLDPLQAIDRIMEEIEPAGQNRMNDIARGVIALRKVRNRAK